ncbi:MAG: putative zinc-binding protein [Burkholderiaceae bacterium]
MAHDRDHLPLVYSCSGCSSAAQLANHLAVRLDRANQAEMSCIAGVGGDVKSLVRKALDATRAKRPVIVIDGCALECARHCLERHDVVATDHVLLAEAGVRKVHHADFDPDQAERLYEALARKAQALTTAPLDSRSES